MRRCNEALVSWAVKEQGAWIGEVTVWVGCRGLEALDSSSKQLVPWWAMCSARVGNFHQQPFRQGVTWYSFFSSAPPPSVATFLRRFIKLPGTRLQPQLARGELSPAACGVLLVPSRSLARPQSVTPSDHWLCAWMPVQRRGAPVNIILTSYELSVLAQIEVKTSWAATGFASPEWSTRQAGWVAKESWRLKLQLKVFREIHPAPGDSWRQQGEG